MQMRHPFVRLLVLRYVTLALLCICNFAHAQRQFNVDDCIIDGLKGVTSDLAAKLVKEACERKQQNSPEWKVEQYRKQLGEVIDAATLELTEFSFNEEPGFHSATFRNLDPTSTVTFVRLKVTPAPQLGKDCDYLQTRFEVFRITLPSGSSAKLVYPNRGGQASCFSVVTVFARDPSTSDLPTRTPAKPMRRDPMMIERQ
jgi:hypothetical protein